MFSMLACGGCHAHAPGNVGGLIVLAVVLAVLLSRIVTVKRGG